MKKGVWGVALLLAVMGCEETLEPDRDLDAGDNSIDAFQDAQDDADASVFDALPDSMQPDMSVDPMSAMCGDDSCGWCESKARCLPDGERCNWDGDVGGEQCWSEFDPCTVASCWDPNLSVTCSQQVVPEDFSSGNYNVHKYATTLRAGEMITIELWQTAGDFEPAFFLADRVGKLLYAGDFVTLDPRVTILGSTSDRGPRALVMLRTTVDLDVDLYVTGWRAVDSGFTQGLPTNAEYELRVGQACDGGGPSDSESVGSPSNGSLVNGVRVTPHPGYVIPDTGRNAHWGTQETIDHLQSGFDAVLSRHPGAQVVQVRDISVQRGGEPSGPWPHSSHESGRDVDLTYHLDACSSTSGCPLSDAPLSTFDAEATWTLFEHWISQDAVVYIFVDTALQSPLREVARARGATDAELDLWFQYPSTARKGFVRHVNNHRNHSHVRFRCPPDDPRCIE